MRKRLIILIAFIASVILNVFLIVEEAIPYVRMRRVVQQRVEEELQPSELDKYKIRDIKKEI